MLNSFTAFIGYSTQPENFVSKTTLLSVYFHLTMNFTRRSTFSVLENRDLPQDQHGGLSR